MTSWRNSRLTRRNAVKGGLGVAAVTAGGPVNARGDAIALRQTPTATLPADAAERQVLRIVAGGSGVDELAFQPMQGGGRNVYWASLWFLPPMYFDVDLNLQPLIFDSWQSNDDFTVWTFTIDPRAHWSDGTPITAAQVKGTWELMTDPIVGHSRIEGYLGNVVGFDQVLSLEAEEASGLVVRDERTLEVQLAEADAIFHWRVATVNLCPVKVEEAREDPANFWWPENNPVCSGPYRLESWDPDARIGVMGKNPNWWLQEGQYLDRIEFRDIPDFSTILLMIQNGEADVVHPDWALPPDMQSEFPGMFRQVVTFGYDSYWLSVAEPTNDINVRKALTLSVNQEDVFQAAFPESRAAAPLQQLLDLDLPCLEEQRTWYPYDPEAARAALAESTYGSAGNLPTLRVTPRGNDPENTRALEAILEFWRQNLGIVNVALEIEPEGFGPEMSQVNLVRDNVVTRIPDTATYMFVAAHSTSPIPRAQMLGYENAEVDQLIEEAMTVAPNDPQRCELALEAQRVFLDDYHALFFGAGPRFLNVRRYVQNAKRGPDLTFIEPWQIYIAAE